MRFLIPHSSAAVTSARFFLVSLLLASCLLLFEAKAFEIPPAPERMLWDKNGVFDRAPAKKAELESALVAFRNRNNYHAYLIVIDNSIGFDLGESLILVRQQWLAHKDGILICVDTSTFQMHLEEVPMVWNEVTGAAKTPRLLREMPVMIQLACADLEKTAKADHINGIPLVEHYTLGLLKLIEEHFQQPAISSVSMATIAAVLVVLVLFGLLFIWWIEHSKARHADERRKEDACVYKFPRITLPIRLGGVSGGLSCERKYSSGDGGAVNYRDTASTKNPPAAAERPA